MLAATWVKMSDSGKKVNKNTYDISSIKRVTRKFLEVSRCSRAKQRQRNVQKSVLHVQSCFFANQTYCCFFTVLAAFAAQAQGRIQDFFLGGGALVSCSTSTAINHIVFFWQNTSCIRKPQVISGGGGVRTPCTLPLDPPLQHFAIV